MSTTAQYRAKAAAYADLAKTAIDPDQARAFHSREISLTTLAENEQWVADHSGQLIAPATDALGQRCSNELTTTEEVNDAGEGGRNQ